MNGSNATSPPDDSVGPSLKSVEVGVFWFSVALCLLLGMLSTFGNGLVIYISNKKSSFGGFREVNWVVKNLAFSDFVFGFVGCPLTIVFWYWGKEMLN